MENRVTIGQLNIHKDLYALVSDEIAPGTGIDADTFWKEFDTIVSDLASENRELLDKRDSLQQQIDTWNLEHKDELFAFDTYSAFLKEIGYLLPEGDDFKVSTENVDPEIASIAGPQLVVPVDNARYALNATNARWGSLYDALYGTDVIDELDGAGRDGEYNPIRGAKVITFTEQLLDEVVTLESGSYSDITQFSLKTVNGLSQLNATLRNGNVVPLENPEKFVGFTKK